MGGGSNESSADNVSEDNDIMAAENAVVLGEKATTAEDSAMVLGTKAKYTDTSVAASDNAIVLGDKSAFTDASVDSSVNTSVGMGGTLLGTGATAIDLGMGSQYLGAGATDKSGNSGTIYGDGMAINSGVQMGDGSSYAITTMDDNTADLLDKSMTLLFAGTENVLEAHAAQVGTIDEAIFSNPEISSIASTRASGSSESTPMSNKAKASIGLAVLVAAGLAMKGKKK